MISTQLTKAWNRRPAWVAPLFIAIVSAGLLIICERHFQSQNASWLPDGFRIHDMTANNSYQTLDVADMNSFGPKSLWYSHVYPPLLDAARYVLMLPETRAGLAPSGAAVDIRLYWLFGWCAFPWAGLWADALRVQDMAVGEDVASVSD